MKVFSDENYLSGSNNTKPIARLIINAIVLFLPFIIVYIYTSGLKFGLDTDFSFDEHKFHYPTILQFARQLPLPDVRDYNSATTPLFHILMAVCSKAIGTDIHSLRAVNFLITYTSTIFFYNILIQKFKLNWSNSLLFAFIFALSPYYFREAFVILTDNLPVLWLLLFFNYYLRYKNGREFKWLLLSLLFIMLLCLTRQTYLFICLAIAIDVMLDKITLLAKLKILLLIFIAAIPTFLLFIIWKGLTPPAFQEFHTRDSFINIKAVLYGLCVLGFYALFIPGVGVFKSLFQKRRASIIICVLIAWGVLFFSPLIKNVKDFGYLWYMADVLPDIVGTSLLFWLLLPIGLLTLLCIWNKEGFCFFILFLLCLFLSEMPNKFIFQRYYDSSIILSLLFFNARYHVSNNADFARRLILLTFFIAYFVVFIIV